MHPALRMQQRVRAASNAALREQSGEVAQSVAMLRDQMQRKLAEPATYSDTIKINQALSVGRHTTQVPVLTQSSALSTSTVGVRDLLLDLHRLGVRGTPLDDPAELARHRRGLTPERRQLVSRAQHRYERVLHSALRQSLTHSVTHHQTVGEAISGAHTAISEHSGSVSRILHTETAVAYNGSRQSALATVAKTHPHIMQRWTELIDANGRPLDKRVAQDSFALHGMVVRVGQPFTIPADDRIPAGQHGRKLLHPPNRPRDRATAIPWIVPP